MKTDQNIDEILAEIGREDRGIDAPEKLERVLRAAASSRKVTIGPFGLSPAWIWAAALVLLAAAATGGMMWQARRSHGSPTQQVRSVPAPAVKQEPLRTVALMVDQSSLVSQSAPPHPVAASRIRRRDSQREARTNSLDEFVALPVSEGLPPATEMSVVRVKLNGSDLQQYGLEAPADGGRAKLDGRVCGWRGRTSARYPHRSIVSEEN